MVSISSRYARRLILAAFRKRPEWKLVPLEHVDQAHLQFAEYERIDFEAVFGPRQTRANCICVRRGLTRKATLASVLNAYQAKHPESTLDGCYPQTLVVSTWDAFNDDGGWLAKFGVRDPGLALAECLQEAYSVLTGTSRWVLKPSIASKGAEILVVRSREQLRQAVSDWPDVREWVLQRYVPRLLLLDRGRKFHLRVFIIVVGAIKVYLLHDYIAFFAVAPFSDSQDDDWTHVTNAYHQRSHPDFVEQDSFRPSCELPALACAQLGLTLEQAEFDFTHPSGRVLNGIAQCLAQVFSAEKGSPNAFQPAPQLFEHFGLECDSFRAPNVLTPRSFLLDEDLNPWLLEFNSGPDLEQAGDRLKGLIASLIEGVMVLGVDQAPEPPPGFSCVFSQDWTSVMDGKQQVFG